MSAFEVPPMSVSCASWSSRESGGGGGGAAAKRTEEFAAIVGAAAKRAEEFCVAFIELRVPAATTSFEPASGATKRAWTAAASSSIASSSVPARWSEQSVTLELPSLERPRRAARHEHPRPPAPPPSAKVHYAHANTGQHAAIVRRLGLAPGHIGGPEKTVRSCEISEMDQ